MEHIATALRDRFSLLELTLFSGLFTLFLTGLGASVVLFVRRIKGGFFSFSLGFSGGIMISTSFWSLLGPALEFAQMEHRLCFLPVVIGFILGMLLLRGLDVLIPHLHLASSPREQEGLRMSLKQGILIFLAITIHNIPEGLAIGVSYGSAVESKTYLNSAYNLSLGIGLQNIPEGLALSLALINSGISRSRSFLFGFLSALVEPIFAILGFGVVSLSRSLLPYVLSLAAGAMIFVTIEELLPSAQRYGNSDLTSLGFSVGFLIMMVLDTHFG
mgnify:CR=1 FL=1